MSDLHKIVGAIVIALVVGTILLGGLSVIPMTADRARSLWRLMRTEIIIVGAVVAIFLAGPLAIELGVIVVALRVGFESADVALLSLPLSSSSRSRLRWAFGLALALMAAVFEFSAASIAAGTAIFVMTVFVTFGALSWGLGWAQPRLSLIARIIAFPGVAVFALALAARDTRCHIALLAAFLLTEIFDSFAVLGGRLFGRHLLFPHLSPNKTIEGFLAGLAALALAAGLLPLADLIPSVAGWAATILVPPAAVAGDLLGSAPKRKSGVKDYPTVLQQQGGLLDILDAWLITGPVLAAVWLAIG